MGSLELTAMGCQQLMRLLLTGGWRGREKGYGDVIITIVLTRGVNYFKKKKKNYIILAGGGNTLTHVQQGGLPVRDRLDPAAVV